MPRKVDGREEKGRKARRAIMEAAADCIAERGLNSTTIADIAARSGLSHALIMFHFKNKTNLFSMVLDSIGTPYREARQRQAAEAGASPYDKLMSLVSWEIEYAAQHPRNVAIWFAFWGAREGTSLYGQVAGPWDTQEAEEMRSLLAEILHPLSEAEIETAHAGLNAMLWGYWMQVQLGSDSPTAAQMVSACRAYVGGFRQQV